MPVTSPAAPPVAHPSGDRRFRMLDATMKKHQFQPDALLEVLHAAQGVFGYLEDDVLIYVAHSLKVPPSRVYGVATFYNFFSLKPKGEHTCVVCTGTACYVKGAAALLKALEDAAGTPSGGTGPDGRVSLLTARCIGTCGLAPAVVFDDDIEGTVSQESAVARVRAWRAG